MRLQIKGIVYGVNEERNLATQWEREKEVYFICLSWKVMEELGRKAIHFIKGFSCRVFAFQLDILGITKTLRKQMRRYRREI